MTTLQETIDNVLSPQSRAAARLSDPNGLNRYNDGFAAGVKTAQALLHHTVVRCRNTVDLLAAEGVTHQPIESLYSVIEAFAALIGKPS